MTRLIGTPLLFWLVLTVLGLAVLAPLRRAHGHAWLPAAPVVGAALTAVVLSATSWGLPVELGRYAVAAAAAGCVVVAVVRRRRFWVVGAGPVGLAVAAWAIGLAAAALAMVPNLLVGDARVISPNAGDDAFTYAALSAWLAEHPLLPAPSVGSAPPTPAEPAAIGAPDATSDKNLTPAFGPAVTAYAQSLRLGGPMVQAALTGLVRPDEIGTTMPVLALWVLVLPGAVVAGRFLRLSPAACLGTALAVTSSALVLVRVANQSPDPLLGVSLAVLALGAVVAAATGRLPRWPAALVLAALVAVLPEYLVFVAPAVLGGVLLRRSRRWEWAALRALQVLAVALVLAPTAWYRGAAAVAKSAPPGPGPSPFVSDGRWAAVNRVLGVSTLESGAAFARSAVVLGTVVAVGCLLAVLVGRHRGVWIGLLGVGCAVALWLTVERRGDAQFRAVLMLLPLVLFAAGAGWDGLVAFLRRRGVTRWRWVVAVALAPAVLLWVFVNVRTVRAQVDQEFAAGRHVGVEYDQVTRWVDDVGGANVTVLMPDLFQQLWVAFALRGDPDVSYAMLDRGHLRMDSYWNGEDDRYLLLGAGVQVDTERAAVVRRNDEFVLLDMERGRTVVAAPTELTGWVPFAGPGNAFVGSFGSELVVVRSAGTAGPLSVVLSAPRSRAPVAVRLQAQDAGPATDASLTAEVSRVPVPLLETRSWTVVIEAGEDGSAATDRPLIELSGVSDDR